MKVVSYAERYEEYDDEREGYLLDHWKGRHSLAKSYWLNLVIISNVVSVAGTAMLFGMAEGSSALSSIVVANYAFVAFAISVWFWGAIGTWKSADRNIERGGSTFWSRAAQVMIFLGGIATFNQVTPLLLDSPKYSEIVTGDEEIGEKAEVSALEDGRIYINGPLVDGVERDFEQVLASVEGPSILEVNSLGGRTLIAERIAAIVARENLDVNVWGECNSACTLILLSGQQRSMSNGSRVGFHRAALGEGTSTIDEDLNVELSALYRRAGLPGTFVQRALSTPPGSMWYPEKVELFDAGVLNHVRPSEVSSELQKAVDSFSGQLPVRLDEWTTLENVELEGLRVVRTYKVDADRADFDLESLRQEMEPSLIQDTCGIPEVAFNTRYGASIEHRYSDRVGRPLLTVVVENC
ncbi:MAG: hypothetical protein HKO13_04365 [Sphingomonas sp.]|nr:hypothetical protein [Sphingomonas sp.]